MSKLAEQAYGDTPAPYPESPGWKEPTTSREAAASIAAGAPNLRQAVYRAIAAAGSNGLTADEAAKRLEMSILAIRPRVTELNVEGSIVDSGMRRKNESKRNAKVWRAKSADQSR